MHVLVLADGDAPPRAILDADWPGWDGDLDLVVAADGGARHARTLGVRVDRWVGDGDSLDEAELGALIAAGVAVTRARRDKDESDTELAVDAALAAGATRLTVVGSLGGPRFDHAMANVGLLARSDLAPMDVRLLGDRVRVRLLAAPSPEGAPVSATLDGRMGDLVSLLPLGSRVQGVTTDGLRYPLRDEDLEPGRTRGLSNVRTAARASVSARSGALLLLETPARLV